MGILKHFRIASQTIDISLAYMDNNMLLDMFRSPLFILFWLIALWTKLFFETIVREITVHNAIKVCIF